MLNLKMSLFIGMMVLMVSSSAFAGTKFSIAGAVDYGLNSPVTVGTSTFKPAMGFGGGALVGFGIGKDSMFEVGGIYVARAVNQTVGSVSTTSTSGVIHIPGLMHFGMGKNFSIGVGGYYDYYTTAGVSADYGAEGALRFSFPSGNHAFFFDAAYGYGLKDFGGVKNSGVMGLIGMTFGK